MRELLDAVLLGLVQGLTEFLPISSSGHLALCQELLGWRDTSCNMTFNVALHVGSLVAVLVFVRRELKLMVTTRPRLLLVLAVATVPIVVASLFGAQDLVADLSGSLTVVGICLLGTAGILTVMHWLPDRDGESARLSIAGAFAVGLAQLLAVLPGVSRSGSTLVAGRAVGLRRDEALRFAFLLALPAILGAGLLTIFKGDWREGVGGGVLAAGTLASFAASLFAMRIMVRVVAHHRLRWFAVYCACVGILALAWSAGFAGAADS